MFDILRFPWVLQLGYPHRLQYVSSRTQWQYPHPSLVDMEEFIVIAV